MWKTARYASAGEQKGEQCPGSVPSPVGNTVGLGDLELVGRTGPHVWCYLMYGPRKEVLEKFFVSVGKVGIGPPLRAVVC